MENQETGEADDLNDADDSSESDTGENGLEEYHQALLEALAQSKASVSKQLAENQAKKLEYMRLKAAVNNVVENLQQSLNGLEKITDNTRMALEMASCVMDSPEAPPKLVAESMAAPVIISQQTLQPKPMQEKAVEEIRDNFPQPQTSNVTLRQGKFKTRLEPLDLKEFQQSIENPSTSTNNVSVGPVQNGTSLTTIFEEDEYTPSPREMKVKLNRLPQSIVLNHLKGSRNAGEDSFDESLNPKFSSTPRKSTLLASLGLIHIDSEVQDDGRFVTRERKPSTPVPTNGATETEENQSVVVKTEKKTPKKTGAIKKETTTAPKNGKKGKALRELKEGQTSEEGGTSRPSRKAKPENLKEPSRKKVQDAGRFVTRERKPSTPVPTNGATETEENQSVVVKTEKKTPKKTGAIKKETSEEGGTSRPSRKAKPENLKEPSRKKKMRRSS